MTLFATAGVALAGDYGDDNAATSSTGRGLAATGAGVAAVAAGAS